MMSITRSTSMTSINGVVLMSIIGSGSPPLLKREDFMVLKPCWIRLVGGVQSTAQGRRFGDEGDLGDAGALAGIQDLADALVARGQVTADLHFGLWLHHRNLLQAGDERFGVGDLRVVPEDASAGI